MREDWIHNCWIERRRHDARAGDDEFVSQCKAKPFEGCTLSFLGFSGKYCVQWGCSRIGTLYNRDAKATGTLHGLVRITDRMGESLLANHDCCLVVIAYAKADNDKFCYISSFFPGMTFPDCSIFPGMVVNYRLFLFIRT